jgi:heat shock protein HslJ
MNTKLVLACALLVAALCGCSEPRARPLARSEVKQAADVTLANTHWRLTQLGGVVIENSQPDGDIYFTLQPSSTNVVGFSGCNRMFGRYALDGASLKFDAMGGTKMACNGRMDLEQRFLDAFTRVAAWKISNDVLELSDTDGKSVATFRAMREAPVNAPAG